MTVAGLPPPQSRAPGDRAVYLTAELVRSLYTRAPVSLALTCVLAGIIVFVTRQAVPESVRLAWLAAIFTMAAARFALWFAFSRAHAAPQDAPLWGCKFAVGAGIAGILWGVESVLFHVPQDAALEIFSVLTLGAVGIGALAALASYLPAFYAFFIPAMPPLAVVLLWHGTEVSLVLGAMVGLFAVALLAAAHVVNRIQARSLALGFDNSGLIGTLIETSEAAHSANLAKAAFLSTASHELRTPLNAIIGFSEILKDEIFGELGQPQYRDYATLIHASAEHLLDVINEILEISKAEGGKLQIDDETVDLERVIPVCIGLTTARAGANAPTIAVHLPPELPRLRGDSRRVKQILLNLLSNAVKFTPPSGRIEVGAERDPKGRLIITVSDTGVGMTAGDAQKATELFARSDVALSKKFPGSGIGLPLTKALVELHDGELTVESRLGSGTRVTVRFPKERVLAS